MNTLKIKITTNFEFCKFGGVFKNCFEMENFYHRPIKCQACEAQSNITPWVIPHYIRKIEFLSIPQYPVGTFKLRCNCPYCRKRKFEYGIKLDSEIRTQPPEIKLIKFNPYEQPELNLKMKLCAESRKWNRETNVRTYPNLSYGDYSNFSTKISGRIYDGRHDWFVKNVYCKKFRWYTQYLKEKVIGQPGAKDVRGYIIELLDEEI